MTDPGGSDAPGEGTREYGRRASLLSVGVGLTGLLTYVYFFIASHQLDRVDYGELTILWSAVFITVSVLYRPVDQLLSRQIAENIERGGNELGPVRVAVRIQSVLAIGFAVVAVLLRAPLTELFGGSTAIYWIFVGAVLFYAASYFARGYLAGLQKFGPFTALILSESFFRTVFAVLVAIGILTGQSVIAVGILAAPLLSLLVVPFAIGARSRRTASKSGEDPTTGDDAGEASELSLTHGAGFVGSVFLIMLGEQIFLNAGPLLIRGIEGVAAAGFIFNVLMIARAPLQLFQAISTSILPHLTSLHHSHDPESTDEFHRSVRMVLAGVLAFTAFTAVVVLLAGPKLMQLAFSDKFTYHRPGLLLVTLGMGLYLASVTVNQACLAQGQARRASIRWVGCAVFFVVWTLVPVIADGALRVEVGFALTALILLASLFLIYRRPHEIESDLPLEGTPEQIETKLAGLEEGAP